MTRKALTGAAAQLLTLLAAALLAGTARADVALCLQQPSSSGSSAVGGSGATSFKDCLADLPCLAQGLTVIADTGYRPAGSTATGTSIILNYGTVKLLPVAPMDSSGQSCDSWTFDYDQQTAGRRLYSTQTFSGPPRFCLRRRQLLSGGTIDWGCKWNLVPSADGQSLLLSNQYASITPTSSRTACQFSFTVSGGSLLGVESTASSCPGSGTTTNPHPSPAPAQPSPAPLPPQPPAPSPVPNTNWGIWDRFAHFPNSYLLASLISNTTASSDTDCAQKCDVNSTCIVWTYCASHQGCQQPGFALNAPTPSPVAPGTCTLSGDAAAPDQLSFFSASGNAVAWSAGWRKSFASGFLAGLSQSAGASSPQPNSSPTPSGPVPSSPSGGSLPPFSPQHGPSPTTCPAGQMNCGTGCIDTVNNPSACGGCGIRCDGPCVAGMCQCSIGKIKCGLKCVDILTDQMNCGTCGHACIGGRTCVGGTCQCPNGKDDCPISGCTNTESDTLNCGRCGNRCYQNSCDSPFSSLSTICTKCVRGSCQT